MHSETFRDFDAFAESVHDVESRFLLRNPGRREWSVEAVDLDGVTVQVGRLGSGNIAQGQLRAGGHMLYVPITPGVDYWANGELLDGSAFAVLEPGCEFCISTCEAHDWCAVFIPDTHMPPLQQGSASSGPSDSGKCRVTSPGGNAANQFRTVVQQVLHAGHSSSRFESLPAASAAAKEIVAVASGVLRAPPPRQEADGRPKLSRNTIVSTCMEILDQYHGTPVQVRDLAAATNVSERTLRAVFQDYFQVGPARYLQLRTLNRIHHALRCADSRETTVAQVCMEHGEWALGRVAARYRKLFGVLPSQTLRSRTG